MTSLAVIEGLEVELDAHGSAKVVRGVDIEIAPGEIVGLVGESGSGKSTIAHALLGYSKRGCHVSSGAVVVDGVDILRLTDAELRGFRGSTVGFIPQDPAAALNPSMRIGQQIAEMLEVHDAGRREVEGPARVRSALDEVDLPSTDAFMKRYPHQLSGGQLQRVAIAMAFILRPKLIVLDEPTTGLDVTTQQRILDTVRSLCEQQGTAALLVSHDLAVISQMADRVYVAYAGQVVECADGKALFTSPRHPYTRALLASTPRIRQPVAVAPISGHPPGPGRSMVGCAFEPRCVLATQECRDIAPGLTEPVPGHDARCHHLDRAPAIEVAPDFVAPEDAAGETSLSIRNLNAYHGDRQVLYDVDLDLYEGECLALVGESGSGKTTLSRAVVGLMRSWDGAINFQGDDLVASARDRPATVRRKIQYVFQSPYNSLNPRRTIGESVATPRRLYFRERGSDLDAAVRRALVRVSLPPSLADRYPDQLSGGERQRASIARALACEPEVLICDEITSALDVSVQAAIVNLLNELQKEAGLTLLFVTHNLALVRAISSRVAVMRDGRVVEVSPASRMFEEPGHDYTRQLLQDTPDVMT